MNQGTKQPLSSMAVLVSGGLDSAILLAECARSHSVVHPLYVRHGLHWEPEEERHLRRFLELLSLPSVQPLQALEMPVRDLYGEHWSVTGRGVPGADSPDAAVFLPGRNVLLLAKAILWCQLQGVPAVALAPLGSNPFPDATPAFFRGFQDIVNSAIGGNVAVLRPYGELSKKAVMERGRGLPLQWTFSCIRPLHGRHCGRCNKCAERRHAFVDAGMPDGTDYATGELCIA